MTRNVTIKIDEALLKLCRHKAVESDKSLSQWIADILKAEIRKNVQIEKAKENALILMEKGFNLGGKPLTRAAIYGR